MRPRSPCPWLRLSVSPRAVAVPRRWASASSPEFCFVARTRRGLEATLRSELQRFVPQGHVSNGFKIVAEDTEVNVAEMEGGLIAPEGKEAEGAVEILGPWRNIYWILRSSLVQSVWFRISPSFPCESLSDLEMAVQKAPWEDFIDLNQLGYALREVYSGLQWPTSLKINIDKHRQTLIQMISGNHKFTIFFETVLLVAPNSFFLCCFWLCSNCLGPIVAWERESRLDAGAVRSLLRRLLRPGYTAMPQRPVILRAVLHRMLGYAWLRELC